LEDKFNGMQIKDQIIQIENSKTIKIITKIFKKIVATRLTILILETIIHQNLIELNKIENNFKISSMPHLIIFYRKMFHI
jgi:hypothetical protein